MNAKKFLLLLLVLPLATGITLRAFTERYYERGHQELQSGELEEAVASFNTSLKTCLLPYAAHRIYGDRAEANVGLERYDLAIADYTQALNNLEEKKDPSQRPYLSRYFYRRGLVYLTLEHHDEAISDFESALKISRHLCDARVARTRAYHKMNQHERTIESALSATTNGCPLPQDLLGETTSLCRNLGDELFESDDFHAAINKYSCVEKLGGTPLPAALSARVAEAHYKLGGQYLDSNDYDNGVRELTKALEYEQRKAYTGRIHIALLTKAKHQEQAGDFRGAVAHYREALEYSSKSRRNIERKIAGLERREICAQAQRSVNRANRNFNSIDWATLKTVNGIIKTYRASGYLSEYEKQTLRSDWTRVVEMTQAIVEANDDYLNAMKAARASKCENIEGKALSRNASMMITWMGTSNETIAFMSEILKAR